MAAQNRGILIILLLKILSTSHIGSQRSPSCTHGNDYQFCHAIFSDAQKNSNSFHKVYTVHQCREICDKESCVAFRYRADANRRQQICDIFIGAAETVEISPKPRKCNETTWMISWKRPTKTCRGQCQNIKEHFDAHKKQRTEATVTPPTPIELKTARPTSTEAVTVPLHFKQIDETVNEEN